MKHWIYIEYGGRSNFSLAYKVWINFMMKNENVWLIWFCFINYIEWSNTSWLINPNIKFEKYERKKGQSLLSFKVERTKNKKLKNPK